MRGDDTGRENSKCKELEEQNFKAFTVLCAQKELSSLCVVICKEI